MPDSNITKAVILAAGRGKRMGGMTRELPKPMLEVHGRPMLEHILERLLQAGITRYLIVVGFQGEVIRKHFEARNSQIELVTQEPVNGTGSGTLLARDFAADEPFLLTYGDIFCDASEYARSIERLLGYSRTVATVAVKAVDDPWQGAAVYEEEGRITQIVEKPPRGSSTTCWNSAGFYSFRPEIFEYLKRLVPSTRGEYELTSALDAMLRDGMELRISPIAGEWRDVGRPEDLAAMNA